jgi:NADPH:quinone reductase-like Zn-dependent oxidoreductase
MKTKAVRLYGKNDLRLEEFELPSLCKDEILAQIISDSICMSSYKAAMRGSDHKRVPNDVDKNPIIIGHEFCGIILEVGEKWQRQFHPGMKFSIQPALNLKYDPYVAPGYSFRYVGGSATHIIIPNAVMEQGCLLEYKGDAYFYGPCPNPCLASWELSMQIIILKAAAMYIIWGLLRVAIWLYWQVLVLWVLVQLIMLLTQSASPEN